MRVQIVATAYNEEDNVVPFCEGVREAMKSYDYELIVVDDGSSDETYEHLMDTKHEKLKVIRLDKHEGKCLALYTGLSAASGDVVATIDSDLQDDARDIPEMIKELDDFDFICGWRYNRKDTLTKRLVSKIANRAYNLAFGMNLHDTDCPVKVFKRECTSRVKYFRNFHRFIAVMAHLQGFKIREHKVRNYPRRHGASKYGFGRVLTNGATLVQVRFTYKRLLK